MTGPVPQRVVVRTPAKLNLFLELIAKRADGYHELESVMVPISLYDTVCLRRTEQPGAIRLRTRWRPSLDYWRRRLGPAADRVTDVPDDSRNLVHRALAGLISTCKLSVGFDVEVRKRIPAGAGLGGGSSDAAAALRGAAVLCGLKSNDPRLDEIAAAVGSDVPFFLGSGPALATGRGEKLTPLRCGGKFFFVVAFPRGGISTAEVYRRARVPAAPESAQQCVDALTAGRPDRLNLQLLNRLSHPAGEISHSVSELLNIMVPIVSRPAVTGSGSACFALATDRLAAAAAAQRLQQAWTAAGAPGLIWVVSTVPAMGSVRAGY